MPDALMAPDAARILAARLSEIRAVSRFDQPGEPQAATLVHSLTDLEGSFRAVIETQLPRLLDESRDSEQLHEVLRDIGDEFRHVLYHLRDPAYFGYLWDDEHDGSPTERQMRERRSG